MLIDRKTIRIVFNFEEEDDIERIALAELVGPNVFRAIRHFKFGKKTVKDAIEFFQKIEDLGRIDDLLGE